ncbi:DUF6207 family protein [Streptomyces sp. NPDC001787]|uniref:DUF6207 family protein n=1 Tax=Streptomyces sp. NPDC001787 TaxID=3154523 RepID=UPI00332588B4
MEAGRLGVGPPSGRAHSRARTTGERASLRAGRNDRNAGQHLPEPCLVVLDITAPDETTLTTVMTAPQEQWAISGIPPGTGPPDSPASEPEADRRR